MRNPGTTLTALLALIWVIGCSAGPVAAMDGKSVPIRPINTVTVRNFDVDDGLPQSTVHAIAQTNDGYLWVATWEGVARFNGRDFRVFDHAVEPPIASGGVRSLLARRDGSLWLGQSDSGVVSLSQNQWRAAMQLPQLAADQVLAMVEDRRGRIHVGTSDHGVLTIDGDQVSDLQLPGLRVLGMAMDSDNRLLLATHRGLRRVAADGSTLESFGEHQTRAVLQRRDGSVLIGGDNGLHWLSSGRLQPLDLPPELDDIVVTTLLEDSDGRLWFGTQSDGLFRLSFDADLRVQRIERLGLDEGLTNLRVLSLMIDREGSLWVGTNGGLTQVVGAPIERFGPAQGLQHAYARCIVQAANGDIFIGTSGGLYQYRDGLLLTQHGPDQLGSGSVTSLAFDATGDLWIGTYDAGIRRLHDGVVLHEIDRRSGMPQLSIRALLFDRDQSLWIGTSEGLVHVVDGRAETIDLFPKDSPDFAMSLALSADGSLWVGTAVGLARRSTDGSIAIFDGSSGYPALDTFDIQFEPDGTGWIASDAGLLRLRDGRFDAIGRAQGMPSDTLFRLLIDSEGSFWVTSNRGLARIERNDIDAVLANRLTRVDTVLLTADSGLTATQVNGGTQPAGLVAADGALWIPTANGVSRIHPKDFLVSTRPSVPLAVEQVAVDGVPMVAPYVIPAGTRRIDFDLAGLVFTDASAVRYRHWLEGFEPGYSQPIGSPGIGYTNLPAGDYVLHTVAQRPDTGRDGEVLSIPFRIESTLLQSRWFQLLLLAAVIFTSYAIYSTRVAGLRRNERRLATMVNVRTSELQERAAALDRANQEKAQLVEQLRHQALHDSLTGLPNRSHADQQLAQLFQQASEQHSAFVIALLDVDHFKQINDQHSHQLGDQVLTRLGELMAERSGLWCARVGGEEFLLLCQQPSATAIDLLQNLRREIADLPLASEQGDPLRVTVSIGWADASAHRTAAKAMAQADRHLYAAKAAGRNRVFPEKV